MTAATYSTSSHVDWSHAAIRSWALDAGLPVQRRGTVSAQVRDKYAAAMEPQSALAPESGGHDDAPEVGDPRHEVWSWVERAQQGDAEAFGLIYERYVDTVFRFVYFRVGNRPLAEDLCSEAWVRALKRISSFTWQGRDLGAWLVTIARNLVADHFKSSRYRLEVTTGDVLDADKEDRSPEGAPENAVVDYIANTTLLAAVRQVERHSPEQYECLVYRFLKGYSVQETAEAMGRNEGAIKALQYRARNSLRRMLELADPDDPSAGFVLLDPANGRVP